ncbi:MAG: hypothetical protein ACJAZ1_003011 [Yoonia sp.]|jgi:hypothetical protein
MTIWLTLKAKKVSFLYCTKRLTHHNPSNTTLELFREAIMTRNTECQNNLPPSFQIENSAPRTLIIGDIDRWATAGPTTLDFEGYAFCSHLELSNDLLRDFALEMILSPLFGDAFDVLDITVILRRLGYRGRYRPISPVVLNSGVIVTEVAAAVPAIYFDLFEIPSEAP